MLTVETRLAQWRSLYEALGAAEQRLGRARAGTCTCGVPAETLKVEVLRLQDEAERALKEVDTALAASKAACACQAA